MLQKGDDALLLLKIDRNPNITVATRKVPWVSRFTSITVFIALPSLKEIQPMSHVTRYDS